jgi:branched-chain amino acid transport system substrate-binding protein
MRSRITAPVVAVALASAVLLAGCTASGGGSTDSASTKQTLKVGMIDALTGGISQAGTADVCGAKIAIKAINSGVTDGTEGVKIDLAIEDDQSNPSTGAAAASKLTSEGRQLFVGGASSTQVLATLPIIDDAGGLDMGGTSQAEEVLSGGKLVVRLNADVQANAKAVAALVESFTPTSVEMVYANNAFGTGAFAGVKADLDPDIHFKGISVDGAQTNFDAVISTLNQDAPDVVVMALTGNPPISFYRAVANAKLSAKVVSYVGVLADSYLTPSGGATNGVYGIDNYESFFDNAANKAFLSTFKKDAPGIAECKGIVPDKQSALTYSQLLLLAQAALKTGSADPVKLRAAMLKGSWKLPQGTVTFGSNGQAKGTYAAIVGKQIDGEPALVEYKY